MKPPFLKLMILHYLSEKGEGTGYDFMKFAREKGIPCSPGSVYPHLHGLEKSGLLVHKSVGRRKVYKLTYEGRRYIEELERTRSELIELYRKIGFSPPEERWKDFDSRLLGILKKHFSKLARINWKKPDREWVYRILKELYEEIAAWKDEVHEGEKKRRE